RHPRVIYLLRPLRATDDVAVFPSPSPSFFGAVVQKCAKVIFAATPRQAVPVLAFLIFSFSSSDPFSDLRS
ncbi:TPA: hypothetical protein M2I27_RS26350, partial [Escherichia coli]